ncbi:MAG TPA: hypothetical protein DC064_20555, partial [Cyanobacteria bacterium UBA9273]|nr:hypothetical protein [Cyanobacteria bacterium UBA9273]
EYLSQVEQVEAVESGASILQIAQLKTQIASLEQTLGNIVQYLNNAELPSRVEYLEEIISTAIADSTRIKGLPANLRQSSLDGSAELSADRPIAEVAEPSLFPVIVESLPEVAPTVKSFVPTWSELRTLKGHAGWVSALAIGSDGQTLVSG